MKIITVLVFITTEKAVVSEFGHRNLTEYLLGSANTNIIITASHGGGVQPDDIPNRGYGCWDSGKESCVWKHSCGDMDPSTKCKPTTVRDLYTDQLALAVREEIGNLTGVYPHIVLCHLRRKKMDANRDLPEAAYGNKEAEKTWTDFHGLIKKVGLKLG